MINPASGKPARPAGKASDFYSLLDHTADCGVLVWGESLPGLFENGALALVDLLTDPERLESSATQDILVEADDLDGLWVNWLREILYLFHGEQKFAAGVSIHSLTDTQLEARVRAAAYAPGLHEIRRELKAATYHQARVCRTGDGWRGTVIFDM